MVDKHDDEPYGNGKDTQYPNGPRDNAETRVAMAETQIAVYYSDGEVSYKLVSCGQQGGCGQHYHQHDDWCENWACDWEPPCTHTMEL